MKIMDKPRPFYEKSDNSENKQIKVNTVISSRSQLDLVSLVIIILADFTTLALVSAYIALNMTHRGTTI